MKKDNREFRQIKRDEEIKEMRCRKNVGFKKSPVKKKSIKKYKIRGIKTADKKYKSSY